jgi:hypothetical protein
MQATTTRTTGSIHPRYGWTLATLLAATACGDADTSCEASDPSCGGGGAGTGSQLGEEAADYAEVNEATNAEMPEVTGYVLDEAGIRISGRFEADDPTPDQYQFNSGTFGGAIAGEVPGLWAQVLVDDEKVESGAFLSLEPLEEDGSPVVGAAFDTAPLVRNRDYVITLSPEFGGKDYVIELRGGSPTP